MVSRGETSWERVGLASAFVAMAACVAFASLGGVMGRWVGDGPWSPLACIAVALFCTGALAWVARRGSGPLAKLAQALPAALDGSFARRPGAGWLVALLLVVSVAQTARLSCFMADDQMRWGSAFPPTPEGVEHMCLASYVQAADLTRQGAPNVYAAEHYPAFSDAAFGEASVAPSPVDNIEPYIEDAYEYPPPFLLLPRLALASSNDYMVHRTSWFMLQALAFLAFALSILRRIPVERRVLPLLLLPAYVATLPAMFTLQFGQWHLAAILLAMGGMLAFSDERHALGGALLGTAVVTKIFPGLLVAYLLVQRRWRAVAWTSAWCVAHALLAFAILGPAPFVAFFEYHLPRIATGEAFSFFLKSDLVIASNYGVYGIPIKLGKLGVPGMSLGAASTLTWIYGVVILGAAAVVARRTQDARAPLAVWLGLLVLASLRSPLAPSVYVAAPAIWLLTLVAHRIATRARGVVVVVIGFVTLGGLPPLPTPEATIAVWMSGQIAMLVLAFWSVWRRPEATAT